MSVFWGFFHEWRLPLLFMISGCGIWYAFGKRSGIQFVLERTKRLVLPLVFGILVIIPPQTYLERLAQGQPFTSFWNFYPHFFEGFYPQGNFTPNHLWFIMVLFMYCIYALPIFLFAKSNKGIGLRKRFSSLLGSLWGILVLAAPLFVLNVILSPFSDEFWQNYAGYSVQCVLVIYGFFLASNQENFEILRLNRHTYLFVAFITGACYYWMIYTPIIISPRWLFPLMKFPFILSLLFGIFGYGKQHLSFNNRFKEYSNEAVYPFYILHQTVTVIIAYYAVQWDTSLWIKFAIVTLVTIGGTWGTYHYLIRPFNILRPLFGMKPKLSKVYKKIEENILIKA